MDGIFVEGYIDFDFDFKEIVVDFIFFNELFVKKIFFFGIFSGFIEG